MIGVTAVDGRSRPPHRVGSNRALLSGCWALAAILLAAIGASRARAQDPAQTGTIYVGGFNNSGAGAHGTFGVDGSEALLDSIAALVGAPVAHGEASLPTNAAATAVYYGDTPPPYYGPADVDELAQVTARWGGGVPRYALILAKYARELLRRSGARQVNFVSGSFGSLIVRWLIEKDVGGLASGGGIARWLSVEGLLAGNWAASHEDLTEIVPFIDPFSIDVEQMGYDWVTANIHSPRNEADSPLYAGILLGELASTNDDYENGLLTDFMLAAHDWQPNDGLQLVSDSQFQHVSAQSELLGLPPTLGLLRSNHFNVKDNRGGWADVATFLTQRRRVAIVVTDVTLKDISEPTAWYWDWRPAEVVVESRVTSPAVAARWGIGDPLTVCEKEGGVAPLHRFYSSGEHQRVNDLLFDGMVLPEESTLRLDLHAEEIDYDWRYNVHETVTPPFYDELGAGAISVSTLAPGTYTFDASKWSCVVAVQTYDYPFAAGAIAAVAPTAPPRLALSISPDPHTGPVRIMLAGLVPAPGGERATLDVLDLSGRLVRSLAGDARGIVWDGRGEGGLPMPAGVYLYRLTTLRGTWSGRSVLIH